MSVIRMRAPRASVTSSSSMGSLLRESVGRTEPLLEGLPRARARVPPCLSGSAKQQHRARQPDDSPYGARREPGLETPRGHGPQALDRESGSDMAAVDAGAEEAVRLSLAEAEEAAGIAVGVAGQSA